ncbi:MAG: peptide chain release factor N(5)-glutamine methyltransferase [Proteobacteria bacterium]|nr:peptide chain release factor N(5)-glutamine methyltransferase [Pseudomonadota bacterium]
MTIQQALQQASKRLCDSSSSAMLDAQILLSSVLSCNSAYLMTWPENELTAEQDAVFSDLIEQRQQGRPVAHLTGTREFWSLKFDVDDSTLIPRPETETLIEFILEKFADSDNLKLLDMGTGTGAIAITLAREKPDWKIFACDISRQALQLAEQNNNKHESSVQFVQSDWFENISKNDFDIIVSNPPYIETDDPHLQQGDVRFEPLSALVAGSGGMDDIEKLCAQAGEHLAENGWLIVEHGYNQQQRVADCFSHNGFIDIQQEQDLSGHIRMTAGKRKF